jgi:diguanylate cyclase (GGDEF)-like protein
LIFDFNQMYVTIATAFIMLGALQLAAYFTRRFERWPIWWGLSNLLLGSGTLSLLLIGVVPDFPLITIANLVTVSGYLLLLASVRAFAGESLFRRSYVVVFVVAAFVLLFVWPDSASHRARIAFDSALFAWCDICIVIQGVQLARKERLRSAWILVACFGATALVFAVRATMAVTGHMSDPTLFLPGGTTAYQWLLVIAEMFIVLRGFTLILIAGERSHNLLLDHMSKDPLTGALNRSGLRSSFDNLVVGRDAPGGAAVSILVIDLDHFKSINDLHGHTVGDEVLRLFTSVAQSELRSIDTFARQGGDEFVVLLPGASLDEGVRVAERIRAAFSQACESLGYLRVQPTLSVGVTTDGVALNTLDAILHRADEALYAAKRNGRNRVAAQREPLESGQCQWSTGG